MTGRERASRIRRRRLLGTVAAGVAGGLAGCAGALSGDDDLEHSSSTIAHRFTFAPANYQLNPWSPGYRLGLPSMLFEYPSLRVYGGDRELTDLVTDVSGEGRTRTVAFSDEFSWWNGEPVTARDRWVAHRIDELIGVQRPWTDVELLDEYTLRYTFETNLRPRLVRDAALGYVLDSPSWLFGEWVERLEGATTEDERDEVAGDLQTTSITPEAAMDRGYGCGPYELTTVDPNRLMFRRFEDHPNADRITVERAWFPVVEGRQYDSLVVDGVVDVGEGTPGGNRSDEVADYVEELASYRTDFGTKLLFNFRAPHVARRNVRRALLAALPLEAIVDSANWHEPVTVQTGLSPAAAERWLGDLPDRLYRYPVERDVERAHEFLRRGGYERRGGSWVGPEGRTLSISLRGPRWDEWSMVMRDSASTLEAAGFDVTLDTAYVTTFGTKVESNNFQAIAWWTDAHPFDAYDVFSESLWTLGYGVTDPDRERSDRGQPVEPTIPAEPGRLAVDGDGNGVTLNLVELWDELRRPTDDERTREILRRFARWWNYDLPAIHLSARRKLIWGNTRDFDWPTPGDDVYRRSGPHNKVDFNLLRTGAVEPTE